MIGQQKLVAQLDDLITRDKFPRFSIVLGERGMEHEDVARYVANKMNCTIITLKDVKVDSIREMITMAYRVHYTTVFCIPNADDMSINAKNALLKVVEDTPNKAYFVMCLEDLSNTLATIESRGIVFRMSRPSMKDISDFARSLYVDKKSIDEEEINDIIAICTSPGDVLTVMKSGAKNFFRYAEYVADNLTKVSGAEVFKFSDKLALKDGDDKYDVRLFLRTLQNVFMRRCISTVKWGCSENCSCELSRCIGRYMQDLRVKGINKTMLIDNLWLEMRRIWKSQM